MLKVEGEPKPRKVTTQFDKEFEEEHKEWAVKWEIIEAGIHSKVGAHLITTGNHSLCLPQPIPFCRSLPSSPNGCTHEWDRVCRRAEIICPMVDLKEGATTEKRLRIALI